MSGVRFLLSEEAILLTSGELSSQDRSLGNLLDFFGVSWRAASPEKLFSNRDSNPSRLRLLCSSDHFSVLVSQLEKNSEHAQWWRAKMHSAFVYAGCDLSSLDKLAKVGGGYGGSFVVSKNLPDFSGVMTGLQIRMESSNSDAGFVSPSDSIAIITSDRDAAFVKSEFEGVPVFLCASGRLVDIESELAGGVFDIRDHVLEALPVVLYIRWAFSKTSWSAPEQNACLVIDDPLLKRQYGFVDYRELLSVMERYKFSTNIAFIPWNWGRTDPGVAKLFRENPEHYSISVHGCAHTRAEFASDDLPQLYGKTEEALRQMRQHEVTTGIVHDRVMVFPQGMFSAAATSILKQSEFIAAVATNTISADANPRPITIADVWSTALMAHSGFPMFTRRYPSSGLENFAFDSLLGKPIIIVTHHDFCRDQYVHLIDLVERLNALGAPLRWRSLAELVRRSWRQRAFSTDVMQIEMFGKELLFENSTNLTRQVLMQRRESDPEAIAEVLVGDHAISWTHNNNHIQFELEVKSGEAVMVRLRYHKLEDMQKATKNLNDRARAMLRRYLCELRDNYVHKVISLSNGG